MQATKEQMKCLDRLKKRSDFLRVQGSGQKWVSKSLVLHILPNPDHESVRCGFTATKRLSKRAVDRNRMKRRLRAAAADVMALQAKKGVDYVLVARAETPARSYDEIKRDLRWCLQRTGYLAGQAAEQAS